MTGKENPYQFEEPEFLLCSACDAQVPIRSAHVVPFWNHSLQAFVTTYRCEICWLPTLGDTRYLVSQLDDEKREKFCQFMELHGFSEDAELIRRRNLQQAQELIEIFINSIVAKRIELSP